MKITDVNVGNGVFRLDMTPTHWGENLNTIPTSVMDEIARDVASRLRGEQNRSCTCGCHKPTWAVSSTPQWTPQPRPMAEPDGFDAHIDRPKRENYGGWDAEWGFQNDLRKYREAERAVKACTWPNREPMKGAPCTQPTHCCAPRPTFKPQPSPKASRVEWLAKELISELTRL